MEKQARFDLSSREIGKQLIISEAVSDLVREHMGEYTFEEISSIMSQRFEGDFDYNHIIKATEGMHTIMPGRDGKYFPRTPSPF